MIVRYAALVVGLVSASAAAQSIPEMQLISAAQDCRVDEAAGLIRQGVDLNARNSGGYTPLMMAAGNGCEEVVRLLLDNGADASIVHGSFGTAAAQAKMHRHSKIQAMLEASGGGSVTQVAARQQPAAPPLKPMPSGAGSKTWPKLGHYRIGQEVLYSGTAGKTWDRGVVKDIDPKYGYGIEGVTGSTDAYFVVGTEREPFWTSYFIGDWKVSVPMAMGSVTDGRYIYRTVSGGMRLPPLRINADGSYTWRVQQGSGEKLLKGRWVPNPDGPGVILKNADQGADWLVYNNSRTGSQLGETVILSSDCCTYYDGSRLSR